jgi:hypothetical protein
MLFFVGLHDPHLAARFTRCMISIARLRRRVSGFAVGDWMLDSGAFSEILQHGRFRDPPEIYAAQIRRWSANGRMLAAVSQDWMCEPAALQKTGLSIAEHQALTIRRFDAIRRLTPGIPILPVLQGWKPADYARHATAYGERLQPGQWTGVGSVCKRNADPVAIAAIQRAILAVRPDLNLHMFGLKITAFGSRDVRRMTYSSDSMAWSLHARLHGRDGNDPDEATRYVDRVEALCAA